MIVCYLGLGSNLQTPERQIRLALNKISAQGSIQITKSSPIIISEPWGFSNQPVYRNQVIQIQTRLSPQKLLSTCQKIENIMGRVRKKKWGPRIIDIDILLYNNQRIKTANLQIPHPFIKVRDFVYNPLIEIASPNHLPNEIK